MGVQVDRNAPSKVSGMSKYQRQQKKGAGHKPKSYADASQAARLGGAGRKETLAKAKLREEGDKLDITFGYERYGKGPPRLGWLFNMLPTSLPDESGGEKAGLDMYFLEQDGGSFKATVVYQPYFYVAVSEERYVRDTIITVQRRFEDSGLMVSVADKEDLDMPNHLSGKLRRYLKLSFHNVSDLQEVKGELLPMVKANQARADINDAYRQLEIGDKPPDDFLQTLVDIREYDVPYYVRCCIDLDIRAGAWYVVVPEEHGVRVEWQRDMVEKAEPRVLAFDIECTKSPLKFPNTERDQVFMISYMVDGQGYLIISREVVSQDIEDFEYNPKPKFPGPFKIFNEANEEELLKRFFSHVRELRPHIFVTYNGDYFDWPFIEARAQVYGLDLEKETGVSAITGGGSGNGAEYRGRCSVHMDAFYWVKRDSYLPQGAHGLKAVTKYKLGYDPVEVDPEDMVRFAAERPHEMASYSVSDAVATFYLYETYVHLFVFSLCTIIPMGPDDVLRKGSGTLCEALLMVEAFRGNIVCPNKHVDPLTKFYEGHLLESETYIGGHVECLETGVFRSDLPQKFKLAPSALQGLIDHIDRDLAFALEVENGVQRGDATNYDEVRCAIVEQLEMLRDAPLREEEPVIYHLDVAAMYPNIILSNRLQPCAIVDQTTCAACDFNQEGNQCKRPLEWKWRGDYTPASRSEYEATKVQLSYEMVDGRPFQELSAMDQATKVTARLKDYARKVYKRSKDTKEEKRVDTVCMRENPFYVNTVRAFRDRRYDYKIMTKTWKNKKSKAEKEGDPVARKAAEDKELIFDSLQLAHKCILNSFYGYVMRKGARWRSMEMAGIVTNTGSSLITQARELVEQIGRPLELDTDGIWCILPTSFPDNFTLHTKGGGKVHISYPCVMLNADVHERYTNHQYQELVDPASHRYDTRRECSIFFEVDGPYRCMVLPSSTEEGKLLKKRYAVFNFDGSLAELKGFELKRRGELELIKIFQSQVFEQFLNGSTLKDCYDSVAEIANHWLDVLDSKGEDLDDDELMDLISENKTISQTLEDYGVQKGTSLTTARRLADFLGAEMVKDKGLNCRLIIATKPHGAPVTDRAIPTAIFSAEPAVRNHFLRKWMKDPSLENFDVRTILDWGYYKERLGKCVQKIITIPAAMQKVPNPVPRVAHPDWLQKVVRESNDGYRQTKLSQLFGRAAKTPLAELPVNAGAVAVTPTKAARPMADMEDMLDGSTSAAKAILPRVHRRAGLSQPGAGINLGGSPTNSSPAEGMAMQVEEGLGEGGIGAARAKQLQTFGREPAAPCPDRSEDFDGWLAAQKSKWRAHRTAASEKRKADSRALARGEGPAHSGSTGEKRQRVQMGKGGLQGYLQSAQDALVRGQWQVVEVRPADTPGDFLLWVVTGPGDMQRVRVTARRTFYLNSRKEKSEGGAMGLRKVSRLLPHNRQSNYLYEVSMPERKFQANEKEVASFMIHPDVEGCYELKTPLLFSTVIHLGCMARMIRGRQSTGTTGFTLDDLEAVESGQQRYLNPSNGPLRRIFLYHSESNRKRGVVGLFFLSGTEGLEPPPGTEEGPVQQVIKAKAVVWIVNPFGTAGEQRPPLERIFQRFSPAEGSTCSFKLAFVDTIEAAWAQADASLTAYQRQRNGPTVVVAQGAPGPQALQRLVPAMAELPVVTMPSNESDGRYPALNWQMFAAHRMVQRFLLMPPWLSDRLMCARYSRLPLANIGDDAPCGMADATFARFLQHNRHVLWASESNRPDLGGAEGDENDTWAEELTSPHVSQPGAYRNVCVELEITGLAINSVINSGQLELLEGSQGLASLEAPKPAANAAPEPSNLLPSTGDAASAGDDMAVAGAFRVLKAMLTGWLSDVLNQGDANADHLLLHFYRWMCARQSLLHDDALHRLVHGLMHKVFSRLVAELRRLGACVVFASFQRVIIATNKAEPAAALEYVSFVTRTLLSRGLFNVLQVEPRTVWEQLLFLDQENFGGIQVQGDGVAQPPGPGLGPPGQEEEADSDQEGADEAPYEELRGRRASSEIDAAGGPAEAEDVSEEARARPADKRRRILDEDEGDQMLEDDAAPQGGEEDAAGTPDEQDVQDAPPPLVSHWDIAEYLPPQVKEVFLVCVGEFIHKPRAKALELRRKRQELVWALSSQLTQHMRQEANAPSPSRMLDPSQPDDPQAARAAEVQDTLRREEEGEGQTMAIALRELVSRHLTERVLKVVPEIVRTCGSGPEAFPRRAGSWRELHQPALEFVKSLCHVLSLDPTVTDQVETLRKQALLEIGVRQFSEEGSFVDPCLNFVLPDVICSFCNLCRDLDLCRDPSLLAEDEEERWRCTQCSNMYDTMSIELALVETVHRRSARYQLQDMRCSKCHRVATQSTGIICQCSAPLQGDEPQEDILQMLRLLRQVAVFHRFEWVQETCEQILAVGSHL